MEVLTPQFRGSGRSALDFVKRQIAILANEMIATHPSAAVN